MIYFHTEDIRFNLKNKTVLKNWVSSTITRTKNKAGEISFVFCTDEYLLKINREYLDHDTYTDIITFDYSTKELISGDILISIDRIKENAENFSKSFEEELHRVIIHGVLHLLGYKDKTKAEKEEMTKQEDMCLKGLKKLF